MTLRVLVVDDAAAVLALHGMFVTAHPRSDLVGMASDGPSAIEAIRTLAPDLVLLDVHMPGQSGIEVLRAVRADPDLVQPEVIAVTAARDTATVRSARLMGVRHYIVKPFTAQELHARIDEVIAGRVGDEESVDLDQTGIDAAMRLGLRTALPKGLTRETLKLVRDALDRIGGGTASEVGKSVGLSRVSTRRYLEHLADAGAVRRSLDYSTAGRPSTRYLPAEASAEG